MLNVSRRVATFLAAVAFAAAPLAQPIAVHAAAGGTLFAIAANQQLVSIDRTTGAFTLLTDLNGSDNPQSFELASDPVVHRLYLIRASVTFDNGGINFIQKLLTVDSRTGAILSQPNYNGPTPTLMVDPATGQLLGFDSLNRLFQINPATGATTAIATVTQASPCGIDSVAIDPSTHTVYFAQENCNSIETAATQLFTIDYSSGAVAAGPVFDRPVRQIVLDSGNVYGVTDGFRFDFVAIDKTTGHTTPVTSLSDNSSIIQFGTATDSATHTTFVDIASQVPPFSFNFVDNLVEVDDLNGAQTILPMATGVAGNGFAFEPAIDITPLGTKSDIASGVDNRGVAAALLSLLNAALASQAQGQCATAASQFDAFASLVDAQSGQHISQATAAQLRMDARGLAANCP